jgi:hypothetical protein
MRFEEMDPLVPLAKQLAEGHSGPFVLVNKFTVALEERMPSPLPGRTTRRISSFNPALFRRSCTGDSEKVPSSSTTPSGNRLMRSETRSDNMSFATASLNTSPVRPRLPTCSKRLPFPKSA